ncbi:hypothetical protein DF268_38815 [Streptomyces sp. V2]|uniref:DUF6907 domain-containing protein n=1 Tax=Streptomyces niveiscabiei TaxID=164115 RepID=A0ABW9HWK4_9ACTN|nr:hypothetical protein [Streptomyces sp. V2]PWG08254.1 hypothetical protein DF268_38815 [Streptomyces sp. V2]
MSVEPRTATVNVMVTKSLSVAEPQWCAGHDDRAQFLTDITHNGPEITARVTVAGATATFLTAWISQSPYLPEPEGLPVLAIEIDGDIINCALDDVRTFTGLVRAHCDVLDGLAVELERVSESGRP